MAVAELPANAIALPRRQFRPLPRSRGAQNLAWIPLVGVLLGIASLFYVAQTGEVAVTGYSIQELQTEVDSWQMRNEQLSLELSKARALPAIEAQATSRLLMVPAREPIFLKGASSPDARPALSTRGQVLAPPALERPESTSADPLDSVRSSMSVLLPRGPLPPR